MLEERPDGGEEEGGGLLEAAQEAGGLAASRWDEIEMDVNRQPDDQVYEFENLEELRLFDPLSESF